MSRSKYKDDLNCFQGIINALCAAIIFSVGCVRRVSIRHPCLTDVDSPSQRLLRISRESSKIAGKVIGQLVKVKCH